MEFSSPWIRSLVVFLVLANLTAFTSAQLIAESCQDNMINYTSNGIYNAILNSTLTSLPSNMDDSGFYNASVGQSPDRLNVIALCRGDVQLSRCRTCVQEASTQLLSLCPNQKQAVVHIEFCMLRISNVTIFQNFVSNPMFFLYNVQNATNPDQFVRDRGALIENLRRPTASGDFRRKVAYGTMNTTGSQTIYAILQCSPDLFPDDCVSCLGELDRTQADYCTNKIGCRALGPSCNFRYETRPFYNETRLQELVERARPPVPPPPPPPLSDRGKDDNSSRTIIIVVVSIVVSLIAICIGIFCIRRLRRKSREELEYGALSADSLQFDFREIKTATDNFNINNKLGEGGFGPVYKGKLEDEQEIAVKRLSTGSGQGDIEFKNEVLLVAKLQHRNLVRLLGFAIEGRERLLVYEFVKNRSLDQFIFDPTKRADLNWEKRYKIIEGIAKGILYLHEDSRLKIIHRDLKAGNVLLDGGMNPKISDFGMAKLYLTDETQVNTGRIVGTYGYMSPEYAMHGQFSVKSDVFSFGVLLLEIISGQKNNSFIDGENVKDLISSTWKYWCQNNAEEIIDPVLRTGSGSLRDILRCIHIGLLCVQENPSDRPKMDSVVLLLSSSTISLSKPLEPAFFVPSGYGSNNGLFRGNDSSKGVESSKSYSITKEDNSIESSKNDVSITDLYPR